MQCWGQGLFDWPAWNSSPEAERHIFLLSAGTGNCASHESQTSQSQPSQSPQKCPPAN